MDGSDPRKMALSTVVEGARQSVQLIQPWIKASSGDRGLNDIILNIQHYGENYYESIDLSVRTAENGDALSTQAINSCDILLGPNPNPNPNPWITDQKIFHGVIADVKTAAKDAHEQSVAMLDKFNAVRLKLFEVSEHIPREVVRLQETCRNTNTKGFFKKSNKETKIHPEMKELQRAAEDVMIITKSVETFANWWSDVVTVMSCVATRSEALGLKVSEMNIKRIRNRWVEIREGYGVYRNEIKSLQTHYSSRKTALSALLAGVRQSIQLIQPWKKASTNDPGLIDIIQRLQKFGVDCCDTIDSSLRAAETGDTLSDEAIDFCNDFFDPESEPEKLEKFIADMKVAAKEAHNQSKAVLDDIQVMRKGLFEVTGRIPNEVFRPRGNKSFVARVILPIYGKKTEFSMENPL